MTNRETSANDSVVSKPIPAKKRAEVSPAKIYGDMRQDPEKIRELFRKGTFPYKTKIKGSIYEQHKKELQVELLKVQSWVKLTG